MRLQTPIFSNQAGSYISMCLVFISMLILSTGFQPLFAQQGCACNNQVNLGLNNTPNGVTTVTVDMILEDPAACPDALIRLNHNNMIIAGPASSVTVDCSLTDEYVKAEIVDEDLDMLCWGWLFIEDKRKPTCHIVDVEISCEFDTDPSTIQTHASPQNWGFPQSSDNCGVVSTTFQDVNSSVNSCGVGEITRLWTVEDESGNTGSCLQHITKFDDEDPTIVWPDDVTMFCEDYDISVDSTGEPSFSDNCGMLMLQQEDDRFTQCTDICFKILRTWEVLDWCTYNPVTGEGIFSHVQIIEVKDTTAPFVTAPDDFTVSTTHLDCSADFSLSDPNLGDNCAPVDQLTFIVTLFDDAGVPVIPTNGTYLDVPLGTYTAVYTAFDCCGNSSTDETIITVVDDVPPVAACDNGTILSLTDGPDGSGWATLCKDAIDDGSYDNCGVRDIKIRKQASGDPWTDCVNFTCEDVGVNNVELRIRDENGLESICWMTVTVEDKSAPRITCPSDRTLHCTDDTTDPALIGEPTVTDNCEIDTVTVNTVTSLDDCGEGTVVKTYTATDTTGNFSFCSQVITIEDQTGITIDVPVDTSLDCAGFEMINPNVLVTGDITINYDCEQVAVNGPVDTRFDVQDSDDDKIIRQWIILDWCNPDFRDTVEQMIKLTDCDAASAVSANISGAVKSADGNPVEEVKIELDGVNGMNPVMTDQNGHYQFRDIQTNHDYVVKAQKDGSYAEGVSTLDILLTRRHVLGLTSFTTVAEYVAADVNGSNTIGTFDILLMRQLILGDIDEFPDMPSWKVISSHSVLQMPQPFAGVEEAYNIHLMDDAGDMDFTAVKLGDINHNVMNDVVGSSTRSGGFTLHIPNEEFKAGETVRIPVLAGDAMNLTGFQAALRVQNDAVEVIAVHAGNLTGFDESHYSVKRHGDHDELRLSWTHPHGYVVSKETELLTLEVKVHRKTRISEVLALDEKEVLAELYDNNLTIQPLKINFIRKNLSTQKPDNLVVRQNEPNPFANKSRIEFILPQADRVLFSFYNVNGELITRKAGDFTKGINEFWIERDWFEGNNLIIYRVETSAGSVTKKMILSN